MFTSCLDDSLLAICKPLVTIVLCYKSILSARARQVEELSIKTV